ncbi:MAG: hypothetical protein HC919_00320 [Oscillatoriales cyanobacterium SM2_2_1]|nr:hypothetical protein [Oscillatoriales cyanobacterium SM2_2_1]
MDEGVITFAIAQWQQQSLGEFVGYPILEHWRQTLRRHHLIGLDAQGISYGNVSLRHPAGAL